MNEKVQQAVQSLLDQFGAKSETFRGDVTVFTTPENIQNIAKTLRDDHAFNMLTSITAVDYLPEENPRFHAVYTFYSLEHRGRLHVKVMVPGINPSVPTIEGIYPNANWYERELWDMFGINVEDHSDLRRLILPFDWEGHPLRKDYPLGYEEVQFTFNFDEVNLRKFFAEE